MPFCVACNRVVLTAGLQAMRAGFRRAGAVRRRGLRHHLREAARHLRHRRGRVLRQHLRRPRQLRHLRGRLRPGPPLHPARPIAPVEAVQAQFGDSLLRLKGILQLEGESQPLVIHGVHGQLYPLTTLGDWPEGKAQTRLVFIVRAAAKEPIEALFREVLAQPEASLEQQLQAMFNPTEQGTDQ